MSLHGGVGLQSGLIYLWGDFGGDWVVAWGFLVANFSPQLEKMRGGCKKNSGLGWVLMVDFEVFVKFGGLFLQLRKNTSMEDRTYTGKGITLIYHIDNYHIHFFNFKRYFDRWCFLLDSPPSLTFALLSSLCKDGSINEGHLSRRFPFLWRMILLWASSSRRKIQYKDDLGKAIHFEDSFAPPLFCGNGFNWSFWGEKKLSACIYFFFRFFWVAIWRLEFLEFLKKPSETKQTS